MPYPSNRPFFANFFAAFRAQSYVQKAPPAAVSSSPTSVGSSAGSHSATGPGQQSQARPITTKAQPQTTSSTAAAVAAHAFQSARSPPTRPHSTSPHPAAAARSPAPPRSPAHSSSFQRSRTPSRGRRGSDSSSDGGGGGGGFKDLRAAQNWYIGGRAPNGEERFYQLGMVRRYGSADRLSLDRLSL